MTSGTGLRTLLKGLNISPNSGSHGKERIALPLPTPTCRGGRSFESTLERRRSIREFTDQPLSLAEMSQLLWAAQGVTDNAGHRTSPSAGALYPLEVYLVARNVRDLLAGVYRYNPGEHELERVFEGDLSSALYTASLRQDFVRDCPGIIVISAVYERTTWKYGKRGERYIFMEVGHVAQNVSLQAVSLNLGTVVVGAFDDERIKRILKLDKEEKTLCLIPVGRPAL